MSIRPFWLEVKLTDGTKTLIRADEVGTIMERATKGGSLRVTIPTKVKTLETQHTLEDFWTELKAAMGGIEMHRRLVPVAAFPEPIPEKVPVPPTRPKKAA